MLSHAIKVKQNLHSKNAFSWRYTLFLLITIRFKTILINISTVSYGNQVDNYAIPSDALKALLAQTAPLEPLVEWQKRRHIRVQLYYSQGAEKYFAKNYKNAIVDFDKSIEINPEHFRAYYRRGTAKYYLQDLRNNIELCYTILL